jgi:predicted dehydrogenase
MATIGVGVIGCGWVGEEHVKAFEKDGRAKVRGLADVRIDRAQTYKDRYNLDCTVNAEYASMLAQKDIDLVVVCTPHDRHTEAVLAAARAGKHVLIEKPAAITLADLRRQQEAVRAAGVKTLVGFVLHWNPLLQTIDRLIRSGALGNIFMVEVDYFHRIWWTPQQHWLGSAKQSGTSILCAGCHAVDALRWFARSEVAEVAAYQVRTENPLEYPGTITVNVKFEDAKVGRTTSCFDAQMPYRFNIGVYGTQGSIRNNEVFAPNLFPGQTDFLKVPTILPDSGDVAHHPFHGEASHFLDCILGGTRPFPDLQDAALTHEVCFAADLSAQTGRPVKISELR